MEDADIEDTGSSTPAVGSEAKLDSDQTIHLEKGESSIGLELENDALATETSQLWL